MRYFKGQTEVIEITGDKNVNLITEYTDILGYSLEVPNDSTSDATLAINKGPKLLVEAGGSREFGGFLGEMPLIMQDILDVSFTTPGGSPKAILTLIHIQCDQES